MLNRPAARPTAMSRPLAFALCLLPLAACVSVERPIDTSRNAGVAPATAVTGSPRDMVNATRAANGLPPVAASAQLNAAAEAHVTDMAANDFYGHTSSNGDTIRDRVERTGYGSCRRAENIASGQPSQEVVVRAWINSPTHRSHILDPKATHMGFAGGRDPGGPNDPLWVMVLATRDC
ncbi:MAG: CAP domain-containing protein [Pseudomonadota bacterium]